MSYDGNEEIDWILGPDGIGALAGGQVFETGVPDGTDLQRYSATDPRLRPYIVARFATPFASTRGRAAGAGEDEQPHVLSFTIVVYGGVAADVRRTRAAVQRRLVDKRPSPTSGVITSSGGFSYARTETEARPSRFESGMFGRVFINL
ncbi:hypothetical protein [Agromyces larvae]|uniref:DUF3168 domain-containing protein n=1 Tax=Agromyces larvae TaxID=2929802 RepID=A0ABY4C7A2_9MICO|nr:hypothetical protein [Agromyces larvae]UOE45883.1 hypothetical protein MTO99_09130 [Agromyces larvae]